MFSLIKKFENNRVFSEGEAWTLFRLAAIGEGCGWTLLISGILSTRFLVHGNNIPVLLAGQLHGMLFFLYALAALGLYPSLHWSRKRALVALIASVPPFGSLLFEQWARYRAEREQLTTYRYCLVLVALASEGRS